VKRILLILICLLGTAVHQAVGGNVVINLRPSYVVPTHGFYNGWNTSGKPLRTAFSGDIQYTFSSQGHFAYQGAGIGVHSFFAHDLLGTPVSIYLLQGAPLLQVCKGLRLGYEWNFGLSAGWKNNGTVTVSALNAYINVAALFDLRISDYWSLMFGPGYTHFSNGDTKFPNGGANTLNFRIGAKYNLQGNNDEGVERIFAPEPHKKAFKDNISYDLTALGGWRADRFIDDERNLVIDNSAYTLIGLQFNPSYHFNEYLSLGPSLDLVYDASANRNFNKGFLSHCAIGVSARGEISMPIFSVNVGGGYNVLQSGPDLKGFYGIFSLKAFLTEKLYLNVTYRLGQTSYAHNMMFGIGWRFRKPH
jgi:hypothetical protein